MFSADRCYRSVKERALEGQPAARQPCRSERQYEVITYKKHRVRNAQWAEQLSGPDHSLYLSVQRLAAHF